MLSVSLKWKFDCISPKQKIKNLGIFNKKIPYNSNLPYEENDGNSTFASLAYLRSARSIQQTQDARYSMPCSSKSFVECIKCVTISERFVSNMWVCARKVHLSSQGQAPTMHQRTAQNVQHGHCLQSSQVSIERENWSKMKLKVMPNIHSIF